MTVIIACSSLRYPAIAASTGRQHEPPRAQPVRGPSHETNDAHRSSRVRMTGRTGGQQARLCRAHCASTLALRTRYTSRTHETILRTVEMPLSLDRTPILLYKSRNLAWRCERYGVPSARLSNRSTVVASTGFSSKAGAPLAWISAFRAAVENAVMKMVGIAYPRPRRRSCISIPDKPGICTSEIRNDVSPSKPESRNSSADANTRARQPSDRTRVAVANRAPSSSSTIETT